MTALAIPTGLDYNTGIMVSSLYIHIPFCRRKCVYCDFYSTIFDEETAERYIEAVISQLKGRPGSFSTIYIGGGTPSVLTPDMINALTARAGQMLAPGGEFTVEVNPESAGTDKLKAMLANGVNRLSIGLQSLSDHKLKKLGRVHNAKQARDLVMHADRLGFGNIGIDSIFGVWGEEPDKWKKELDDLVKLPVKHISCYALSYEKGTPLWEAVRNRSVMPLDDVIVAGMYEAAIDTLSLRGFKQYEVSNFAQEGFRSRHNSNYWENDPYIGIGASAVSYVNGAREKNVSDIGEYIGLIESGNSPVSTSEKLDPKKRAMETAAVKIRTKEGIDFKWFREKTGFDFMELEKRAVDKLIDDDLIKFKKENNEPSGICLKRKGFLFCDTVSSALL